MRAIADAGANGHDPKRAVIDAVRKSLADLDACPVTDLTDDIEMAELIGRLKSLVGVLVSVIE